MASRRHERRKQCLGKVRHETEREAEYAARVGRGKGRDVHPYHCSCCGGYHIGHPPGTYHYGSAIRNRRGAHKRNE